MSGRGRFGMFVLGAVSGIAVAGIVAAILSCAAVEAGAKSLEPIAISLGEENCAEVASADADVDPFVVDLVCLADTGEKFLVHTPRPAWRAVRAAKLAPSRKDATE